MKLGLVLEGGAHRTVFSCGVMDALLDAGIRADYVIGSSAGITYGISYVSGQKGRNREMLRRYAGDIRYAGLLHWLNPWNRSYYNVRFLFDTIPNKLLPYDYAALEAFEGEVLAAVTNVHTGRAEYLPVTAEDRKWKVLQATCSLPLMFHPVTVDGVLYADGGIADSVPFEKALEDGCDKLIAVLTRVRDYHKEAESVMNFAASLQKRKHPEYAKTMLEWHEKYNESMDKLRELEQAGVVYCIVPEDTLGVSRTDKRIDPLMSLYAQGYALTMQQMPALRSYLTQSPTEKK
jgi:predicted patatin/cPLA2 family phospholipase